MSDIPYSSAQLDLREQMARVDRAYKLAASSAARALHLLP
jgi:hypothetical protein